MCIACVSAMHGQRSRTGIGYGPKVASRTATTFSPESPGLQVLSPRTLGWAGKFADRLERDGRLFICRAYLSHLK